MPPMSRPLITACASVASIGARPLVLCFDQLGAGFFLGKDGREIAVLPLYADRMGVNVLAVGTEFHLAAGTHRGITIRDVKRSERFPHLLWISRCCPLECIGEYE